MTTLAPVYKLSSLFAIPNYDIVTISDLIKGVRCLQMHYELIIGQLNNQKSQRCQSSELLKKVGHDTVIASLKCALVLLCELKVAIIGDNSTESTSPSEYVKMTAKRFFDYLAETPELAVLDAEGLDVKKQDPIEGYSSIYSYGVYLTGTCCAAKQVRYLVECGKNEYVPQYRTWGVFNNSNRRSYRRSAYQPGDLVSFDLYGNIISSVSNLASCAPDGIFAAEFVNGNFYGLEDGINKSIPEYISDIEIGHKATDLSYDRTTGKTYVTSSNNEESILYELNTVNGLLKKRVTIDNISKVTSIMINYNGDAYVIDADKSCLHKIKLVTGETELYLSLGDVLDNIGDYKFSFGPDSFIYGTDMENLIKINPNNGIVKFINTDFHISPFAIDYNMS